MKSPFLLTALATLLASGAASATTVNLPQGYEPILQCEAQWDAPEFKIARKNDAFFLAANVGSKTAMIPLENDGADYGYLTFVARNSEELGELNAYFEQVLILNNEEDIENPEEAVHTSGAIRAEGRDDQECEAVGEPRVNPID